MIGVYCITHRASERRYIGSSVDVRRRWRQHCSCLDAGTHRNQKLQNAWLAHGGEEAFDFDLVEEVVEGQLIERERFWHSFWKPFYNHCLPESGGTLGLKWSDESRAKLSASLRGRTLSQVTKDRISAANRRRPPMSDETRAKIAAARRGKKHSPETIEKMRAARHGEVLKKFSAGQ